MLTVDANRQRVDDSVSPAGHTAVGTQRRGYFASQIAVIAIEADGTVRCFRFILTDLKDGIGLYSSLNFKCFLELGR